MGRTIWNIAVIAIFAIAALGLLADIGIYLVWGSAATITDYLRANPAAFWWPAAGLVLILVVLAVHLFVVPLIWK